MLFFFSPTPFGTEAARSQVRCHEKSSPCKSGSAAIRLDLSFGGNCALNTEFVTMAYLSPSLKGVKTGRTFSFIKPTTITTSRALS